MRFHECAYYVPFPTRVRPCVPVLVGAGSENTDGLAPALERQGAVKANFIERSTVSFYLISNPCSTVVCFWVRLSFTLSLAV